MGSGPRGVRAGGGARMKALSQSFLLLWLAVVKKQTSNRFEVPGVQYHEVSQGNVWLQVEDQVTAGQPNLKRRTLGHSTKKGVYTEAVYDVCSDLEEACFIEVLLSISMRCI